MFFEDPRNASKFEICRKHDNATNLLAFFVTKEGD